MGVKLEWTGALIFFGGGVLHVPAAAIVGIVIWAIGCVLMWLDK